MALATSIFGQTSFDWNVKFEEKLKWLKISDTGNLLINNKNGLFALDPEKNGVSWHYEDLDYITEEQIIEIDKHISMGLRIRIHGRINFWEKLKC